MRIKHIWFMLLALLLCSGAVVGCGTAANPPQSQTTSEATVAPPTGNDAYPAPSSSAAYPYPAANAAPVNPAYPAPSPMPTSPGRDPEPIPQPSAGMGVVHGKVYNVDTDQAIYDGVIVYLSHVIKTDNSEMDAVVQDATQDLQVTPDNQGGFTFADVPPGRYGIVVQAPINQSLAHRSDDTTKELLLTVEAGQTMDLGKIYARYP